MTVKDAEAERLAEIIAELRRIKVPTLYTGVVFEATELLQGILTDQGSEATSGEDAAKRHRNRVPSAAIGGDGRSTQKGAIAWPSRATS